MSDETEGNGGQNGGGPPPPDDELDPDVDIREGGGDPETKDGD